MQAFLTGSRVYGSPREDSDIDLVVFCSEHTRKTLEKHKDGGHAINAVRFGKLNLILCDSKPDYDAWQVGTLALQARGKSVDRETAKNLFMSICPSKQLGVSGD